MKEIRLQHKKTVKLSFFFIIFLYLALFFCFEPKLFVKFLSLNVLYIAGVTISFVCIIALYWKKKESFPVVLYFIIAYRLCFFVQTLISAGDILMWGYMSIVLMTLCLVIHYFIKRNAFVTLDAIINVLAIILTVNLIIGFVYPKGVVDSIYFIGIRTRFTDLIFPLLACVFIELFSKRDDIAKWQQIIRILRFITVIAVCIITLIKFKIATALLGFAFAVVAFFIFWIMPKLRNIWFVIVLGLLANYLVVFLNIAQYFEWLISDILGKSLSLSGRTEIWSLATDIVKRKLLFGYGMAEDGGFVYWNYSGPYEYWQAHNQWLQLLYDGGLLLVAVFIALLGVMGKKLKYTDGKISAVLLACIASFMVMMITEIYSYTPYLFIIIFLSQYLDCFTKYKKLNLLKEKYGILGGKLKNNNS